MSGASCTAPGTQEVTVYICCHITIIKLYKSVSQGINNYNDNKNAQLLLKYQQPKICQNIIYSQTLMEFLLIRFPVQD